MKYLIVVLLCVYGLSSCSTGPSHEVEVQMDCSVVVKELRRGSSVEFNEVLKATNIENAQGEKEFIALFFKTAKHLYPKKPLREYFKIFKGVGPGATDAQVRKGVYHYRSKLISDLKNQLTEELSDFGVESIDVLKGKDVLKIVCSNVDKLDVLKAKFSKSNFLRIYEVLSVGSLSGISYNYVLTSVEAKLIEPDTLNGVQFDEEEDIETESSPEVEYDSDRIYVKEANLEAYLNRMNAISKKVLFLPSIKEVEYKGEKHFEVYPCAIPRNKSEMITDSDLKSAVVEFDEQMNSFQISITMTEKGSAKFSKLSGENVGEVVAMVVNDRAVFSAPVVNGQIDGGKIQISGDFTKTEAHELAAGLNVKNWRIPCSIIAVKKIK